jgi:hypothetical protein
VGSRGDKGGGGSGGGGGGVGYMKGGGSCVRMSASRMGIHDDASIL